MIDDFAGRQGVALVTGGTGGLGSAIVRMLVARGSRVAITYRSNSVGADALVEELGDARLCSATPTDLRDADVCRMLVDSLGDIHTLVHAAGPRVDQVHLSRIDPSTFATHLRDEAETFFTIVSVSLSALRETSGSIVAVTSAGTSRHPARDALSTVPKASIEALVRGIAAEEGRFGVRANAVGPGMLTDGMAATLIASGQLDAAALDAAMGNIPLRRFGSAIDVAEAVCFLASPRAGYVTGQKLDVDGGYTV